VLVSLDPREHVLCPKPIRKKGREKATEGRGIAASDNDGGKKSSETRRLGKMAETSRGEKRIIVLGGNVRVESLLAMQGGGLRGVAGKGETHLRHR